MPNLVNDWVPGRIESSARNTGRNGGYTDRGPLAVYVLDGQGRFEDANTAACRQFGYGRDELLHSSIADFATADDIPAAFAALRRTGTLSMESTLRRKDGSTFTASVEATRLSPDRYLAFVVDITELVAHEAALRQERDRAQGYLDTVQAIIVALDVEGRITLINRHGCRLLGYEEHELVGRSWFATCLPQPEGMEEVYPYFRRLIAGEERAVGYFENPVVTRSGELREIAWHNTLLRDDAGNISGTLSAGEDKTDRKRLEQQLQQSQKLEAIGTLAGGVAHDMNNVLAMVLGLASVTEHQLPDDHPARTNLRDIVAAANRGKSLVESLLGFARKGQYEKRRLSINEIVRRLVGVLTQSLPKRIALETSLAENLGTVRGDDAQLAQTLMNLCINAADAIEDRGTITITTRNEHVGTGDIRELIAGHYARVDVRDDGQGMTEAVRAKAFEPFFTTKDIGKGTGLGLSMAYGVITNHHGTVRLDSQPNRGTTVSFWLPIVDDVPEHEPATPRAARAPTEDGAKATVLVVDDEELVRRALCKMLEILGYAVLAADGGRHAIEQYRAHRDEIDLVLLDLSMPDMDGEQCFAELQAIDADVRVLLCTGHGAERATEELRRRGAVGLARKPFGPDTLSVLLEQALGSGEA